MPGSRLRLLSLLTVALMTIGLAMVAFYAPLDADQGFAQKVFYLHVPMSIVALGGFVWGGVAAGMYLRTRDPSWDLRSYCALHHALILAIGVLLTGMLWGKAAWGAYWVWEEPTLVAFLIVSLLYVTYSPLRFAIEDREKQARYASVFAVIAAVFVPINFAAVRMASSLIHPRTFDSAGNLPGSMALTFLVCLLAMLLLFLTLVQYEITQKRVAFRLRALRRELGNEVPSGGQHGAGPELDPSLIGGR